MYGLIGKKLGHSFSADFFNKKFNDEGIDEEYKLFPLDNIDQLPELLDKYQDLRGLNVTIPYKQAVIPYLTNLSDEILEIGAVNVIKIDRENSKLNLTGFNSDIYGFRMSLLPLLSPAMRKALVLGSGGASKAVSFVLNSLGIEVTEVSRTKNENNITYDMITEPLMKQNLLIVNTTPLGMFPDIESFPPIPYQYLTSSHLCYDLVYNPEETVFLKKSSLSGASVKNGLEMLHLQAIRAWEIWRG